jgi:hypothetical protein
MWDINRAGYTMLLNRASHPWDVVRNNQLIAAFLRSDCDVFVKMDIDQKYPVDYLGVMVPLVEKYKVVGPLIYDRWQQNGFMPLLFDSIENGRLEKWHGEMNGVQQVPYSHTNLFYAREALESVPKPWYEAYMTEDGLGRANHVDFTFLDKLKNNGYPIYINMDVVVQHIAEIGIDREFYERWHGKG